MTPYGIPRAYKKGRNDSSDHDQQAMSTIIAALTNFGQSLVVIGLSLVHSVLAVFQAVFALLQSTIENILKLGQSITTLVLELFQGVFGFVVGRSCFRMTFLEHNSSLTSKLCCNFGDWWSVLLIQAQTAGKGTKGATEEEELRGYIHMSALPQ